MAAASTVTGRAVEWCAWIEKSWGNARGEFAEKLAAYVTTEKERCEAVEDLVATVVELGAVDTKIVRNFIECIGRLRAENMHAKHFGNAFDLTSQAIATLGIASGMSGMYFAGSIWQSAVTVAGVASGFFFVRNSMASPRATRKDWNLALGHFFERFQKKGSHLFTLADVRSFQKAGNSLTISELFEDILYHVFAKNPDMPHRKTLQGRHIHALLKKISIALVRTSSDLESRFNELFLLVTDTYAQNQLISDIKKLYQSE